MNADDILDAVLNGLRTELGAGFGTIKAFAERQGSMLAKRAASIAKSRINGEMAGDDEFFEWAMKDLEDDTANLARSIAMLTVLTIEKAWNAVANALWGGIRTILTAAGVPAPLIPDAPPHV
jgi:hypothetical protein